MSEVMPGSLRGAAPLKKVFPFPGGAAAILGKGLKGWGTKIKRWGGGNYGKNSPNPLVAPPDHGE